LAKTRLPRGFLPIFDHFLAGFAKNCPMRHLFGRVLTGFWLFLAGFWLSFGFLVGFDQKLPNGTQFLAGFGGL